MNRQKKAQAFHLRFYFSVIGKGINGMLDIVGGALLFFLSPDRIHCFMRLVAQHKLSEDPDDLIAAYLLNSAHRLTKDVTLFSTAYHVVAWRGRGGIGGGSPVQAPLGQLFFLPI